jgi:glutamate-1-semialdehyde 2,1-aminomutase
VPAALAELTMTLNYNDSAQVREVFAQHGHAIAAVIVEPVAGNMNCVPPAPGFLETLREVTEKSGAILIFDEVMTGFRVALGGAQALYGIRPDLTVLGKVIGGGLPVGAVTGPAAHLDQLAPAGPVYQAGTLSGNPLAMASGLATLELISAPGFHAALAAQTAKLCQGIEAAARDARVPLVTNHVCGMFGLFFSERPVTSFADVMACDVARFKRFFHALLEEGVNLAPSAFEAGFLSSAHGDAEIEHTVAAVGRALARS